MKIKHPGKIFLVALVGLFVSACTDKNPDSDANKSVNQAQFLANTTNIMSESYESANSSALLLSSTANDFSQIAKLRNQLKNTWKAYQRISFYDFGTVESSSLKSDINIYKTDTALIEASISNGNFDLDQLSMKNAKGFPALDYLLNQKSETETTTSMQNVNRRQFTKAVINDIVSRMTTVSSIWKNKSSDFKNNMGTGVGSSTGMLVNSLNQHYEKYFRDNKIGIPLGVRSSGIAMPEFVESPYGEYSVELAMENFKSMKNIYLGIDDSGNNGYGLDDYLKDSDARNLTLTIEDLLEIIDLKLTALSDPLPQQVRNNSSQVQDVYNEIQKLIVLWKVDMPSRMGVLITYQDNDGD